MNALRKPIGMFRERWLEHRKTTIGASDVPVILGLIPQKSAYTLFQEKRGMIPPPDVTDAMDYGLYIEPYIGKKFTKATGRKTWRPIENIGIDPSQNTEAYAVYQHPDYEWLFVTPDFEERFEDDDVGPLECKAPGEFVARAKWTDDEAPIEHIAQHQIQMSAMECTKGSIAGLVGRLVVYFDQERNDRLIKAIIPKLKEFYERVMNGDAPPVDGSQSTADTLSVLHPKDDGSTVFNSDLEAEALQYLEIKESMKAMDADLQAIKNRLVAAIGDATFGVFGCTKFSFKHQSRAPYTVEASECRVLRKCK